MNATMEVNMIKRVVARIDNCEVIQFGPELCARFKILRGKRYIGKVSDGGYRSKASAIRYIENCA